jgi:polyisoprenoid-binding protein YceI
VLGPNFFNATEFPTITFKSNKLTKSGDNLTAAGDLNFHGVTKPITVTLATVGPKQTRMGTRSGFETTFTIKRSDYGFAKAGQDGLGDEVQLTISAEGTQGQ